MLDRLVHGVDCGIRALSEVFAGPVHSYCRLETVDDGVLVADDGSLISLLRLEGSLKQIGVEEFGSIVSSLTEKLQSSLSRPGHLIQVLFEYDPREAGSGLRNSCGRHGLPRKILACMSAVFWMTGEMP